MILNSLLIFLFLSLNIYASPVKFWHLTESNFGKAKEMTPIIILFHRYNETNGTLLLPAVRSAIKKMGLLGIHAGEVNCTQFPKLCKHNGIKKNCSSLLYYNRYGNHPYHGEINEEGILDWVKRSVSKSLRILPTMEDIEQLYPYLDTVFIGHFPDRKNIEYTTYDSVVSSPKDRSLFIAHVNRSVDDTFIEYINLKENWTETFDGKWDWGTLSRWVGYVQSPFVEEIKSDNSEHYFKTKSPVGFFIYDGMTDDVEELKSLGTKISKKYNKALLPVLLDNSKYPKVTRTLGLHAGQLPGFTILAPFPSYDPDAKAHYPLLLNTTDSSMPGAWSGVYSFVDDKWRERSSSIKEKDLYEHIDAFFAKALPLRIRSQKDSEIKSTEYLIHLTGNTFNKTSLNLDKNVLVLVESDWCTRCRLLRRQLSSLAQELQAAERGKTENLTDLVIAKFDNTENDIWPYYSVFDHPSLLLFKKEDKMKATQCNEVTSIEKIKRFLKKEIPNFPLEPNAAIIAEEDERQRKRERMEQEMGVDKSRKKFLFEDEL